MKRRMMVVIFLTAASLTSASCSGCLWDDDDDRNYERDAEPEVDEPPSVASIELPDWPPLGPDGQVSIVASDDRGLGRVEVVFACTVTRYVSGTRAEITVSGRELCEGFGSMYVIAWDYDRGWAMREVTDLLVDLTPPEIELPENLVGAGGSLEVWVGDAWILGSAELRFEGSTLVHEFPQAFPSTLGEEWDRSIVSFPAEDLPAGTGQAEIIVHDAAGNESARSFELIVDAEPPRVEILEPEPGAVVYDFFVVTVTAADNLTEETSIEIQAGGAVAAQTVGPYAEITLDAREFTPGPIEIQAFATDEAGNRGAGAPVPVVVK